MSAGQMVRGTIAGLASLATVVSASAAWANTVHFEAESVRDRLRGTITSPLLIKDDPAASGGSYVTVAPGNNSPSGSLASSTDGIAKYTFSVNQTATYRIWARVSAPNTGDDSFWIRMGTSGSFIRWNGIPLGAPYHWVLVKAEGAANPATFNLTEGADNQLHVAYREDGTRLDAFIITNDTSLNPNVAPAGPPALPIMQPSVSGVDAVKLSWSSVAGATSYTIERNPGGCSFDETAGCCVYDDPWVVVRTGITEQKFTDTIDQSFDYRVTAVGPTGSSVHPLPDGLDCAPDPSKGFGFTGIFRIRTIDEVLSVTPPIVRTATGIGAPAGTNSTGAPPAKGRVRYDFETALPTVFKAWVEVEAPNKQQDSFWVRVDDGTWINWNNLTTGCDDVHDSSKAGSPVVHFNVGAGSHRIEWAYREGGAKIDGIFTLIEDLGTSEQCND